MADQEPADPGARYYLTVLRGELSRRGARCELIDHGTVPRLRVYPRGDTGGTEEFDNNIDAPRGALVYPRCSREELKGGSWA